MYIPVISSVPNKLPTLEAAGPARDLVPQKLKSPFLKLPEMIYSYFVYRKDIQR
jgi:hypothetical protein